MKISVIIPSYNRSHLLERTLDSIVCQTYKNVEIIVVDDASTDDTAQFIQKYITKNPGININYVRHEVNNGEAGARNTGIKQAQGEIIAFLDSDDEWLPEKLEKQIEFLKLNNADGVCCEYFLVSEDGLDLEVPIKIKEQIIRPLELLTKGCNFSIGSNLLIKKEKVIEFFDEKLKLFVDIDWLYRITRNSNIKIQHEPLTKYYKSPMRQGEYVKARAGEFLEKYNAEITQFPLHVRLAIYSCINWYIAVSYNAHRNYSKALRHYFVALLQMPRRKVGNYYYIFKLIFLALWQKLI